jgi:hypothetical protein
VVVVVEIGQRKKKLKGFELTSVSMIDQKGEKRKIMNLSETLSEMGLSINEAAVMDNAQTIAYGSAKKRFERFAYNVMIETNGDEIAITKRDADGFYNRFHLKIGDGAKFASLISKKTVAVPNRVQMGWIKSAAMLSCLTDRIAELVSSTSLKVIDTLDRLELEELHHERFRSPVGEGSGQFRGLHN